MLPFVTVNYSEKTLPAIRLAYRVRSSPGSGVNVVTRMVGDPEVRVLVTTPDGHQAKRPAVLSLHGGGMIVGSPQLELMTHGRLARDLGAVVVAPDYRLAPENPFPAALDDCMATLDWMREQADELGIDTDRIAVVGASAGGGLAAAVAQRSHDEGIALRAQGLIYPMLDDRTVLERRSRQAAAALSWTPEVEPVRLGPRTSAGSRGCLMRPTTQRLRAVSISAGLPPAWIGVGDLDLYYDEDVAYAREADVRPVCRANSSRSRGCITARTASLQKAPSMRDFSPQGSGRFIYESRL